MSANHHLPYIVVLPEDDANRDIVNGFREHLGASFRQLQVAPVAGGWHEVLDLFASYYVRKMRNNGEPAYGSGLRSRRQPP
jgi:hypothetical protein